MLIINQMALYDAMSQQLNRQFLTFVFQGVCSEEMMYWKHCMSDHAYGGINLNYGHGHITE